MFKIYKYAVCPSEDPIKIKTYRDAQILSCGLDGRGEPSIWVLINDEEPEEFLNMLCVGTGWPLDSLIEPFDNLGFVGTINDGPYVWHVFEVKG